MPLLPHSCFKISPILNQHNITIITNLNLVLVVKQFPVFPRKTSDLCHHLYNYCDWLQVLPDEMADKLFEACGTDSFDKLDSTVKVRLVRHICVRLFSTR